MKKNKHLWSLGIGLFSLFIFVPATLHITWAGQDESKKPESELTSKQIGAAHAELKKAEEVTRRTSDLTETVAPRLAATGSSNYRIPRKNLIDEHVFGAMERDGVPHASLSNDYEFCRRVYIDVIGRIPTPKELLDFVNREDPDKRDKLIDELVESEAWVDRWSYWFGDEYRSNANRSGWPATRNFDTWIRQSLRDNKPYDQFVSEMLVASAPNTNWTPDAGPSNYLARSHVFSDSITSEVFEDTADEIVVNLGRNFLGVNLQCISCHDGAGHLEKLDIFLTSKTREEFWAMSAFFGDMRMRKVIYQDRFIITEDGDGYDPEGPSTVRILRGGMDEELVPAFILTGEQADPRKPLRPQLARMLTGHPQFARATANIFWKEYFVMGIVDPVDSFDMARLDTDNAPPAPWTIQPTNVALLNDLAKDFVEHNFDLRHLHKTLVKSSAYQLSSRFSADWQASYTNYFARKYVRMMWAGEIHDSVSEATQVFGNYPKSKSRAIDPTRIEGTVKYLTQLASPEGLPGSYAAAGIHYFLHQFGQANREQFDRQSVPSVLQAMLLMNHDFVNQRVKAENGSRVQQLVRSDKSSVQIVDDLFLATLSRYPTQREKELSTQLVAENRVQGAEDLHWSLINKLDFIFNY